MPSDSAIDMPGVEPTTPANQQQTTPVNKRISEIQTPQINTDERSPSSQDSPCFVLGSGSKFKNNSVKMRIRALDVDGDGKLSRAELESAIEDLVSEEKSHKKYKLLAFAVIALLIVVLLANMGLAYAVTMLAKETTVKGSRLYSKHTSDVIQVDTSSFKVSEESFRARGSSDDGLPLETVLATTVEDISPYYSNDFLAAVQAIRLSWPGAGSASLRVLAFSRPAGGNGSVIILTSVGYVTVLGSGSIEVDADVESFLIKTGVFAQSTNSTAPGDSSTAGGTGLRRRLLQTHLLGPVETFAQYEAHMTRVCEVTASIGAISQEDFDSKYAQCWSRKLATAARKRSSFIDGGGIVVPDGLNVSDGF
eukprot:CAMPEP_0117661848 /NCGR_PEP_ID=MMETSP0804-20121206/7752_1 /TAXON_ID=1074897 /ORGANISM="Tetraselmis astigmatica, Strain CCMP880" /LENGTH=364 /DNA_ID=CAMNT_0005468735 /DNA_START=297 /DNA_END=1391 /DNA_ORIENTATION=+